MSGFRAWVSFVYSRRTPARGNDVTANGMRHRHQLKKFVEEFYCRYK